MCDRRCGARSIRTRDVGAKRVERVIGDQSAPHQAPQRIDRFARDIRRLPPGAAGSKKLAPVDSRTASSFSSRSVSGSVSGRCWASSGSLSERKRAMRPSRSPIGSMPAHATSPAAISVSSPADSYPATRAGRMEVSSSEAGIGAPCRLSIASSKTSRCACELRRGESKPCQCDEESCQRVLLHGLHFAA